MRVVVSISMTHLITGSVYHTHKLYVECTTILNYTT